MYLAAFFPFIKRTWSFVWVICTVACVYACSPYNTNRLFMTAEDLMAQSPDSALTILNNICANNLHCNSLKARHALLLSMAMDKNYIDVTEDSTISFAYKYYSIRGSKRNKMLSAYYRGVVFQNAGNSIPAATMFDEALALAQQLKDNHYCGLACRHLSSIHANNYNHVLALEYARRAAGYFDSCNETLSADYARANMARQLSKQGKWDESLEIINMVLDSNDYAPLTRICRWLKTDILLFGKQDYDQAMACLEQITIGRRYSDSLSYYGYHGLLSAALNKPSEADYYFKHAKPYVKTELDSLTLWNQISEAYQLRKDYANAYDYLLKATTIQNKEITTLLGQSVTRAMEEHYRQSWQIEKERSRTKTLVFYLTGTILILITILLVLFVQKLKKARIQDMLDICSLNEELLLLQNQNKYFKDVCNAITQERSLLLTHLADSYFSWTDEEVRKREKKNGLETKEEIISVFRHQLSELRSNKQLFSSIEKTVNYSKDNLIMRLRQACEGKLKEYDINVLTLLFSGLSIKSAAFLLRMTEPALRTRKSRYKQLFESMDTPESSLFINSLN